MSDAELIEAFVAEFTKGEPLTLSRQFSLPDGVEPKDVAPLLAGPWQEDEETDVGGWAPWRPLQVQLPRESLKTLYAQVTGPLPPLYEQLILSYQWGEVDLEEFRLLPSFPPSLQSLVSAMTADAVMFRVLSSHQFVQFGRGPDIDYDPVCFDLNARGSDGDCAIVKLDHEDILIRERVRVVAKVADSFRQLVLQTTATTNGAA